MQCLVEITAGWNGDTVKSTVFHGTDVEILKRKARKWIFKNRECPRGDTPYWTMTNVPHEEGEKYISDYGSWSHFGRCTITGRRKQTQEKTMSKKKPYSKVRNANVMRALERERNKIDKNLLKKGDAVPEWYRRLLDEWTENYKNLIKLNDFLYITEVEGGDTRFTDEALKLAVCDRKLLVKQEKAMFKFVDVLTERVNHGFCTDIDEACKTKGSCKDCGDKVDAKTTTDADAKGADKAATKKVAKKSAKKAVKKSVK